MKLRTFFIVSALLLCQAEAWALQAPQYQEEEELRLGNDPRLTELTRRIIAENRLNERAKRLNLGSMELTSIEGIENIQIDGVKIMGDIETLNLGFNQLTALPDSIGNLTHLQDLFLYKNQLTVLPDSIGKLTNLRTLNLAINQLAALPDSIGNLTHLELLALNHNQLTELPDSIGQLTNLHALVLAANQLTILPDSISQLRNLLTLDLGANQLTILPDSIGNLTHLELLALSHNQLTELPDSIGQLTNLQTLVLFSNPLTVEQIKRVRQSLPPQAYVMAKLSAPSHQKPTHVAQKPTHRKKSSAKVAKHAKKEKGVVA